MQIFGSVFGKSKKSVQGSSSGNQNGSNDESSEVENNESFVFLGQPDSQRPLYPQPTMLTNEFVMGASTSSAVYPSLDVNGTNPKLPFSSLPCSSSLNISTTTSRHASPIDNVPFYLNLKNTASNSTLEEDRKVTETLDRIQQFMNNANLSEYNFKLENSILRESLFT